MSYDKIAGYADVKNDMAFLLFCGIALMSIHFCITYQDIYFDFLSTILEIIILTTVSPVELIIVAGGSTRVPIIDITGRA